MKLKHWLIAIIILASTAIASRDLFQKGYFSMHDDLQIGRLYQMDLCFKDGQIPCRWVPDMGYSYGYPLFNFYPQFPYLLGEGIHVLGISYIDSTKIVFILGFLVSGILMFLFARKLWGDWGGVLSSVLYFFAPYHSVDIYVRGAMNEFWALAFLPGVFWAVTEIIERDKDKKFLPVFSVLFSLLLLSHNLMALIFTPCVAIFAFLLIWLKKKNLKEKVITLFLGGIFGACLSAFFTLPVIVEQKYVHVDTMLMGYFNYLAHFVPIKKLLFTRFWGYGSSGWLQETGMPFQVGLPQWPLAVLVFIVGSLLFWKKKIKKDTFFLFLYFFVLFLATLFMVHPRSTPIWQHISLLAYLQFPWRFLTLVIFSISVLGGGVIILLKNKKVQIICSISLLISAIALNLPFFKVENILNTSDNEKLFSAKGWNRLQTDAIFDYLPLTAKAPPAGPAPSKPEIKEGSAEISNIKKGTNWYNFEVDVKKESVLQIPLYDFPVWKALVDKKETMITHDNFLGLITIKIPEGKHIINLKLTNTPLRTLGNLISGISWLFLLLFFLRRRFIKE